MTILIPVFLILFAGWVLLAWSLAEDQNLKWLRILCARLFVVIVFVVGLGAGVVGTRMHLRRQHRDQVQAFVDCLRLRAQMTSDEQLRDELQTVADPPDEWSNESHDVLERLNAATDRMQQIDLQAAESDQVARKSDQRRQF